MNMNFVLSEENYWCIDSEMKKADKPQMLCLWRSGIFLTE